MWPSNKLVVETDLLDLQAKIEDLSAQAQTQAAEQFTRRPETEQIQSKATVGEHADCDRDHANHVF